MDHEIRAARLAEDQDDPIRFAVGVAATGNPPDIAHRLFQPGLVDRIWERLVGDARNAPAPADFSQDTLVCR